jgi:hypothetical protein
MQAEAGVSHECVEVTAISGNERDLPGDSSGGNQNIADVLALRPSASGPNGAGNVGRIGGER